MIFRIVSSKVIFSLARNISLYQLQMNLYIVSTERSKDHLPQLILVVPSLIALVLALLARVRLLP